jgi:hypothetical protein
VRDLAAVLREWELGEEPALLLTNPDFGPYLAYTTGHSVLAAPYHRHPEGILDAYGILAEDDEGVSRRITEARGVDLVVLCPVKDRGLFDQAGTVGQTLFRRLVGGRPPEWLRPLELPESLEADLMVFEVQLAR